MTTMRGSITPSQVLTAYRHGLFPMARGRFGSIEWFLAEPRTVIPLDHRFHVPRTIKKLIRKTDYRIEINKSFEEVLRACARHNEVGSEEIWLSEEMIQLYLKLHELGHAHSIEIWTADGLAGGLYGVALKGAFFGESMFSRTPSSSQIALVALVEVGHVPEARVVELVCVLVAAVRLRGEERGRCGVVMDVGEA